ncbi:proline-rich protein 36-like [Mastomys coucha]|uniref:proline-rich protein 36-like n=1 Tax=Mastomys coucha TaxID=35658 RepID=UPI001261839D|nr:proline-rich protein 36-like [Mastomys coucha]
MGQLERWLKPPAPGPASPLAPGLCTLPQRSIPPTPPLSPSLEPLLPALPSLSFPCWLSPPPGSRPLLKSSTPVRRVRRWLESKSLGGLGRERPGAALGVGPASWCPAHSVTFSRSHPLGARTRPTVDMRHPHLVLPEFWRSDLSNLILEWFLGCDAEHGHFLWKQAKGARGTNKASLQSSGE